ncbi:hypothetical protein Dsin_024049 [Dipteronia sinensis]|uniref:Uncharacterized protein n=1 Tax=Dipteronia sinensis TaxID=43782 RepID=A0AAE0E1N2_9ROSI|nr:hypothetical protein Dsin_024049 [Dipteronia sinensis]
MARKWSRILVVGLEVLGSSGSIGGLMGPCDGKGGGTNSKSEATKIGCPEKKVSKCSNDVGKKCIVKVAASKLGHVVKV